MYVDLKIADYCPFIKALDMAISNFPMSMIITIPSDGEIFLNPNTTNSINNIPATNLAHLNIPPNGAELWIETYTPDDYVLALLKKMENKPTIKKIKYLDVDTLRSAPYTINNGTQCQIQFPSAFNRRPVFSLFGFQYQHTFGQQYANPHSYVNIFPSQTYVQWGQGQLFPSQPIISDPSKADFTNLYQEFLDVANIRPDLIGFTYNINYNDYRTTYPFLAFNYRNADLSQFSPNTQTNITLFTDMNLINAVNYNADVLSASQNGTIVYNTLINGVPVPDFPANYFYCYCFLVVERTAQLIISADGLKINMDLPEI